MKLIIKQKPQNGFLGGTKHTSISVNVNNVSYDISIQQQGIRIISIDTNNDSYEDAQSVFYLLETLLMLFDGHFFPIVSVFDGTDITNSWNDQRLPSHTSADFMLGTAGKLLDYDKVLNTDVFYKWIEMNNKLDLVHKMVLYCLSDVKMPKDMQCAYMVEAVKGLCRPIHDHNIAFAPSLFTGKEPILKLAFLAVVDEYGPDIFNKEISQNKEKFTQILINTRNRIAHINEIDEKQILPQEVYIWYIIKLSLLYRVALLDLLGIQQSEYCHALKAYIQKLDSYPGMKPFIKSLTKEQLADDPELKIDIYSLLYTTVYSTAIYKVIHARRKYLQTMDTEQAHFWSSVSDNCLQQAVIDWCKVFGSYDERTHYAKIHTQYIKEFEKAVFDNNIDFAAYSKGMKNFRDTFIAHLDKKKKRKPIPKLEDALTICYLYEEMVICGDPGVIPFDLKHFYNQSQNQVKQYFDSLEVLK